MSDTTKGDISPETSGRASPSQAQVKVIIEYLNRHPQLAQGKPKFSGHSMNKYLKWWSELSNILNAIDGTFKSRKGWIKFWADKKRHVRLKQRRIQQGISSEDLCPLEKQILNLSEIKLSNPKKKKLVKIEATNGYGSDDCSDDEMFSEEDDMELSKFKKGSTQEPQSEVRYTNIMEKIVDAMDQQASALAQMAQASLDSAKALERVSEAAHIQAMSIERLSHRFVDITSNVQDVRNSIINIDYTIKRLYTTPPNNERHNTNFFT